MLGVGPGAPRGVPCLHCCGGPLAAAAAALPAPLPQAACRIPTGITPAPTEAAVVSQAANAHLTCQPIARHKMVDVDLDPQRLWAAVLLG